MSFMNPSTNTIRGESNGIGGGGGGGGARREEGEEGDHMTPALVFFLFT